jgi:hypothetical protein
MVSGCRAGEPIYQVRPGSWGTTVGSGLVLAIVWVDAAQGPSPDDEPSHARFREKYSLPTFVIDEHGNVAGALRRVKPEGHAERVLEALPG